MSDHAFSRRTYVRLDVDQPVWFVVEAGRTLATVSPFSSFESYEDAVAEGFDGEEPEEPKRDRISELEDAVKALIIATLEPNDV